MVHTSCTLPPHSFFSTPFWFGITCPLSSRHNGMYTLDGFLSLSIQVFLGGCRLTFFHWCANMAWSIKDIWKLSSNKFVFILCTQKCVNEPTKSSGYVQLETSHCDWEASLGLVLFQISHLSPCLICFVQKVRHVRGVGPILFSCPSSGCPHCSLWQQVASSLVGFEKKKKHNI
jgi:hypothetical protein